MRRPRCGGYRLLVIEDDPLVAAILERQLKPMAPLVVTSVGEALAVATSSTPLCAAIVDLWLPDGSGVDTIPVLRHEHPGIPVLVLTGGFDQELLCAVQQFGVEYLLKPPPVENLRAFGRRVLARLGTRADALLRALEEHADRHGLTRCERRVVALRIDGVERRDIAPRLNLSENTARMLDVMAGISVPRTRATRSTLVPFAQRARIAPGPLRIRFATTTPLGPTDPEIEAVENHVGEDGQSHQHGENQRKIEGHRHRICGSNAPGAGNSSPLPSAWLRASCVSTTM